MNIPPDLSNCLRETVARCSRRDRNAALYTAFANAHIAVAGQWYFSTVRLLLSREADGESLLAAGGMALPPYGGVRIGNKALCTHKGC